MQENKEEADKITSSIEPVITTQKTERRRNI